MIKSVKVRNLDIGAGRMLICGVCDYGAPGEIISCVRELAKSGVDLIEWRADPFIAASVCNAENADGAEPGAEILAARSRVRELSGAVREAAGDVPVIFTVRTSDEGGLCAGESMRDAALEAAIETHCMDIIDIPYDSGALGRLAEKARSHAKIIVSCHDFGDTPEIRDMVNMVEKLGKAGDIAKYAVMARDKDDAARAAEAGRITAERGAAKPFILIAMGEAGSATRRPENYFGSCITYAKAPNYPAPGQIELKELLGK